MSGAVLETTIFDLKWGPVIARFAMEKAVFVSDDPVFKRILKWVTRTKTAQGVR